jgi:dephospho-CoA kinase
MLRIGLTGGIGSGKSTVAQIFEVLGIPVYYADAEAKRIMNTDAELKKAIIKNFGDEAYKDGLLNRAYISSIVFNDQSPLDAAQKLDLLNSLVHPATKKDGEAWMKKFAEQGGQTHPYAIHEAALIFEASVDKQLDKVIGVYAPLSLRIKRAMERDKVSEDEILKRISRQMDEETKMKRCDFIITNDEQHLLIPQVIAIHHKLSTG